MDRVPNEIWIFIGLAGSLFAAKTLYGLSIALVLPATRGALYVSTARARVTAFLDVVALQPEQLVVDLGCGDGRVLRSAGRRYGARGEGYELNPLAYLNARLCCIGHPRITIRMRNFWKVDLSEADLVFCYLFPDVMPKLARKLSHELKPGATIVSCNFPLPGFAPEQILRPGGRLTNDPIFIYQMPFSTKTLKSIHR